jgi:hypothetical protein
MSSQYDTLSYETFPEPVQNVLDKADGASANEIQTLFESEFGPDLLESKGSDVIDRVTSRTPERAKRQLLGTLATLHYYRNIHEMPIGGPDRWDSKLRFDVATLSNGSRVYLLHPGYKAFQYDSYLGPHPMDIALNIEGWENPSGNTTPLHKEIFSDFYWKLKEARLVEEQPEMGEALVQALTELHEGAFPNDVLNTYADAMEFSVGNELEPLFHSVFWIFIQEDLNYAQYGGRITPHEVIEEMAALPLSAIDTTEEAFPETVTETAHEPYYSIIDSVKGYTREDGQLLPVSDITQPEFAL